MCHLEVIHQPRIHEQEFHVTCGQPESWMLQSLKDSYVVMKIFHFCSDYLPNGNND